MNWIEFVVQIVESITVTTITLRRLGSVMYMKLLNVVAPSISAASYSSPGIDWRPARNVIVQNGVPCQITANRIDQRANSGRARKRIGVSIKPTFVSARVGDAVDIVVDPLPGVRRHQWRDRPRQEEQ